VEAGKSTKTAMELQNNVCYILKPFMK